MTALKTSERRRHGFFFSSDEGLSRALRAWKAWDFGIATLSVALNSYCMGG